MSRFKISDTFLLDDKPIKILSGAIHYFRIPKDDWEDSLYNLKALGFNTVETYVPWNFHETIENEYDFKGHKDLKHFIELAAKLDFTLSYDLLLTFVRSGSSVDFQHGY